MAAKLVASMITLLAQIGIGIMVFVLMLVAMNGFGESDAQWGILAYIIFAGIVTLIMTGAAAMLVHRLAKRTIHSAFVVLISAVTGIALGGLLIAVSGVAGVIVAEIVRRNF